MITIRLETLCSVILLFVCVNLQLKRMGKHNNTGSERRAQAANTGKVVFQLDKICKDLQLTSEELLDTHDEGAILDTAIRALRSRLDSSMAVCSSSSSNTILHSLDKNLLSPSQRQLVSQIAKAMRQVNRRHFTSALCARRVVYLIFRIQIGLFTAATDADEAMRCYHSDFFVGW